MLRVEFLGTDPIHHGRFDLFTLNGPVYFGVIMSATFCCWFFWNERNDLVVSGSANLIVKNAETTTTVCVVGNFRETCNGSRCGTNRYLPNSCCAVTSDRLTEVKTWRFFNVLFWKLAISNANPSLTTVSGGIIWKKKKKKRTRHTTDEASSLLEQGRIKNRPCLVYYRYIHCGIACHWPSGLNLVSIWGSDILHVSFWFLPLFLFLVFSFILSFYCILFFFFVLFPSRLCVTQRHCCRTGHCQRCPTWRRARWTWTVADRRD